MKNTRTGLVVKPAPSAYQIEANLRNQKKSCSNTIPTAQTLSIPYISAAKNSPTATPTHSA
ncbi:MAG: hypothetical protein HDS18_02720 [Bacteroides sp.]|nr:hypothetical protein [Bacteroides sp.]